MRHAAIGFYIQRWWPIPISTWECVAERVERSSVDLNEHLSKGPNGNQHLNTKSNGSSAFPNAMNTVVCSLTVTRLEEERWTTAADMAVAHDGNLKHRSVRFSTPIRSFNGHLTRSPNTSASSMKWVVKTIVRSRRKRCNISQVDRRAAGSIPNEERPIFNFDITTKWWCVPLVGSSRITTLELAIKAMPTLNLRFIPIGRRRVRRKTDGRWIELTTGQGSRERIDFIV